MTDSEDYLKKKRFFAGLLTIYGRKPVLEALENRDIKPYRLHMADTNKSGGIVQTILDAATRQGVEVQYHGRDALSRLSKNKKQDQGVVLDVEAPNYQSIDALDPKQHPTLIALENVTNPQNVGMAIRSVGASPANGLILPQKGCAPLDALVIKASAGTVFKSPIFHCEHLSDALAQLKATGYHIVGMTGAATERIDAVDQGQPTVYLLGNETHGLTNQTMDLCHQLAKIPMANGVESLNVSVTAAIVAFRSAV